MGILFDIKERRVANMDEVVAHSHVMFAKGGILADEMGLGKTTEGSISLVLSLLLLFSESPPPLILFIP